MTRCFGTARFMKGYARFAISRERRSFRAWCLAEKTSAHWMRWLPGAGARWTVIFGEPIFPRAGEDRDAACGKMAEEITLALEALFPRRAKDHPMDLAAWRSASIPPFSASSRMPAFLMDSLRRACGPCHQRRIGGRPGRRTLRGGDAPLGNGEAFPLAKIAAASSGSRARHCGVSRPP